MNPLMDKYMTKLIYIWLNDDEFFFANKRSEEILKISSFFQF